MSGPVEVVAAMKLRIGDELVSADPVAVPDGGAKVAAIHKPTVLAPGERVEVWTDQAPDPNGMPCVWLRCWDRVEVRRESGTR